MPNADHKNRTWITPYVLPWTPGGAPQVVEDSLDRAYQSRWYVLEDLHAGDDVTVTLELPHGFTEDYTLLGFTDIRAKALQLLRQLGGRGPLDADDMDSDDMDSDDMDSDDMDSDDMDSDDMDSDDMDSDDQDQDGLPDVSEFADVYASAQRHALRSASVTAGPADEQIHMTARAGGGALYFRVRGHHGAFAQGVKYRISAAIVRTDLCAGVPLEPAWRPLPSDARGTGKTSALILVNSARPSLGFRGPEERDRFVRDSLGALAHQVDAVVYDLARDDRLAALYERWSHEPGKRCVPLANTIVQSIRMIVTEFAVANELRYLVIVGGDDVIPFARIEDRAEISREWQWMGPYTTDSPLGASLTYGYHLSDDPYGHPGVASPDGKGLVVPPLDPRGKSVRAPTVAVGRLVESATDIRAHIEWFLREGHAGIALDAALVSGYTFVADLGSHIATALTRGGVAVDASLVRDDWTADDLAAALGPRRQLIAAQGHYSANTLVPARADTARLVPTDPRIAAQDLSGRIWITIGCHSGHNIVDREARPAYKGSTSWPEMLLRRGVTLIGGTGYQYAESVLLENSEKLYTYLAQELVRNGTVNLGDAHLAAKRRYLEGCFRLRGMDEKLIEVSTLYGLPMLAVRARRPHAPDDPLPADAEALAHVAEIGDGVRRLELTLRYELSDERHADGGAYFTVEDRSVATPLRPVLPAVVRDVTLPGFAAMGVVWTGGSHRPLEPHEPLVALPVLEERPRKPHYRNRAFLPFRPLRIVRSAGSRQTLVFAPMQYLSVKDDPPRGTRRLWTSATVRVYYANRTDRTMLLDAPAITDPVLAPADRGIDVRVDVRHYGSVDEPVEAFASYLEGGELRTVALVGGASTRDGNGYVRRFSGLVPGDPSTRRVFFQAAGGNGRVSALSSGGQLFGVRPDGARRATALTLQAERSAGYRDRLQVTARLERVPTGWFERLTWLFGRPSVDGELLFRLGGSRTWKRTTGGVATATLTIATRPRDTSYLLVASFPGAEGLLPCAASLPVTVGKARTELVGDADVTLVPGARREVARLRLAPAGRPLGSRAIVIRRGRSERIGYTDPDGALRLEPDDVAGAGEIDLLFEGDERYDGAGLRGIKVGIVAAT